MFEALMVNVLFTVLNALDRSLLVLHSSAVQLQLQTKTLFETAMRVHCVCKRRGVQ